MPRHYYTLELRVIDSSGEEVLSCHAPPQNREEPGSQIMKKTVDHIDFCRLLDVLGFLANQKGHRKENWWDMKIDPKFVGTLFDKMLHSTAITDRTWRRASHSSSAKLPS